MGLTNQSMGIGAYAEMKEQAKRAPGDRVIALAGNPNVGKSTVFNALTGMNQHTGNWPGKTVTNAQGICMHHEKRYVMVDIPGTYSLLASSVEEEVARDFICFGHPDATVVVADATCLERNLNLVLQVMEVTPHVVLCVNLMDEAKKKHIQIDLDALQKQLGIPVVGAAARSGTGLDTLMDAVESACQQGADTRYRPAYPACIEQAIAHLMPWAEQQLQGRLDARWVCLKLLERDELLSAHICEAANMQLTGEAWEQVHQQAMAVLEQAQMNPQAMRDAMAEQLVQQSERIYRSCVKTDHGYNRKDRKIDRFLTSKATGIPVMLLLMGLIFWITIQGANVPSALLADGLFWIEDQLALWFTSMHAPAWLTGLLVHGMYRTLAWVVSVMLPPMAIFFPLFTLLEDSGYLPRIAFNMDSFFKKACAHGKQSLTMCMGFGCNACGVIGCRIIDSPRERLIAILTNNFVPCNGRFPTLIAMISMFFATSATGAMGSVWSTLLLMGVIVLGVCMTLLVSRALSKTILRGMPSSFALELPPYRRPQVGKVIVRSIFDRTLFVLGRAVAVAAPAGFVIWLLANVQMGGASILTHCTSFFDPLGKLMGLDGVILMAFILGFPANEIVVPIIIMSYLSTGSMLEMNNLTQLHLLLVQNGWTWVTALCTMLFSLMHFPCGTTCWTIRKETKSTKWTLVAAVLPTVIGMAVCIVVSNVCRWLM